MLVRPFSDIHIEFWKPHKIQRILGMVVPPLPNDRETVALIAGDLGLAHRQEPWLKALGVLGEQFRTNSGDTNSGDIILHPIQGTSQFRAITDNSGDTRTIPGTPYLIPFPLRAGLASPQ